MPRVTKKECWDILEDRLLTISETRIGKHLGEAKLAVSVLISAGRDEDTDWIESNLFSFYCKLAGLHIDPTKELILKTLEYLNDGGKANFRQAILEA
jgi:hypothetical protein